MTTTTTGVPPAGWYATAEGSHERYWDGETWSAPRRRVVHVITHPKAEPDAQTVMPDHPYRDLPNYATVPPYTVAAEAFHAAFGNSGNPLGSHRANFRGGPRTLWIGAGFAWMAALWPAVVTYGLIALDAAGFTPLSSGYLWAFLVVWITLAVADTLVVRRQLRARGQLRPGSDAPRSLSWLWGLIPPVEILARTRVAHSSSLIPVALYLSVAYPVVWFMPPEWIESIAGFMSAMTGGASTGLRTVLEALGIHS